MQKIPRQWQIKENDSGSYDVVDVYNGQVDVSNLDKAQARRIANSINARYPLEYLFKKDKANQLK